MDTSTPAPGRRSSVGHPPAPTPLLGTLLTPLLCQAPFCPCSASPAALCPHLPWLTAVFPQGESQTQSHNCHSAPQGEAAHTHRHRPYRFSQLQAPGHLSVLDLFPTISPQKHNSRQIHSFYSSSAESHRYHQLLPGPQPLPQATHILPYGHPSRQGTVHYL